jgi:hypothetical protein
MWRAIAGMVILLMVSCGQNDSGEGNSSQEKKALSVEVAGICHTVLNFNDLMGKKPNVDAFNAYAELLQNRKTYIDNNYKNEMQSISGFSDEWNNFDNFVNDLKKGSTEDRANAQKKLYKIQNGWIKKFHIE